MRTVIVKLSVIIISLVAMATLVIFSSGAAGNVARFQAAAVSHTQPGPEFVGSSIGALMDNLYAASGR